MIMFPKKSNFKTLGALALAVVGASVAHADAYGYAYGYASASFYESQAGMYYTANSGTYWSSINYNYEGSNWAAGNYLIGSVSTSYTDPFFVNVYGYSSSGPQVGGSGIAMGVAGRDNITITNTSSLSDTLAITVYTFGYGLATAGSYQDYAIGEGIGQVFDSAGLLDQYSIGEAESLGLGYGGTVAGWQNYDAYNGLTESRTYYGGSFPNSAYAYVGDTQTYYLTFAPGATDTFSLSTGSLHAAFSITPAPAAIAPFGLGLIAALRRRKRT